jgi:DNA-binding response OmpR family regulator
MPCNTFLGTQERERLITGFEAVACGDRQLQCATRSTNREERHRYTRRYHGGEPSLARGVRSLQSKQRGNPRLLLVDDDRDLCNLVTQFLEPEGFLLSVVHTGGDGVRSAVEGNHELIILDVMLPDKKGFDVLREIRTRVRTPVLMLTAKGDEFDRILGLELGADDYLAKPFSPRELIARISAILRRSGWQSESNTASRPPVIHSGDIELDLAARTVSKGGEPVRLTTAEFDLLRTFFEAPGQVLTREALVEKVLDRKFSPFDRSIDLHVSNLRRKLGPQGDGTERIRSVRGIGYLYAWPTQH